jgi:hypothetical protein
MYWKGSHHQRMKELIGELRAGASAPEGIIATRGEE